MVNDVTRPDVLENIDYLSGIIGPSALAKEMGVNRSTLWRWSTGKVAPNRFVAAYLTKMADDCKARVEPILKKRP